MVILLKNAQTWKGHTGPPVLDTECQVEDHRIAVNILKQCLKQPTMLSEMTQDAKRLLLTVECMDKLYETFRHDLTDNQRTFNSEVKRWQGRWSGPDVVEKPKSLMSSLAVTNKEPYPSIFAIFSILVTMPVTTSTTERSFSALRRQKIYLRSIMVQDRQSSLALIHVHREMDIDKK
ncbi:unnamed protein product [Mytilus coruscus]|uniref:HAT C-terminal dimerisation domain-containing protein n=1 Tax=Mytilus coruscus TaxID=42192 RepID=A0A6J8EZ01_MYTCO|nr:unnamed protein product [Mytilus coruscus]